MKSNLAGKHLYSIGEVIATLSREFPDLSISKIRFLEAEGLITPLRAPSGYRKFTNFDRERIRYILELQHDHYLPLRVIREHLDAVDSGTEKPIALKRKEGLGERLSTNHLLVNPNLNNAVNAWLSPMEFAQMCNSKIELIEELIDIGLITLRNNKVHSSSKDIFNVVIDLTKLGVPVKHLRIFKLSTDREISLAEAITKPTRQRKGKQSNQQADEQMVEILSNFNKMHQMLLSANLKDKLS